MKKKINIFFRQPFTEANEKQQVLIQSVLNKTVNYNEKENEVCIVTGSKAQNKTTFRSYFEKEYDLEFTPSNFRKIRLNLLSNADLFIVLRTAMSESSSFEIAYNIFKGKNVPMLFLIDEHAAIKTTLIRELNDIATVTYHTFESVNDASLKRVIHQFIKENTH